MLARFESAVLLGLVLASAGAARAELIHPVETPASPVAEHAAAPGPYGRGVQALERKDFDSAQRAFAEAAKMDPRSAEPLIGLAEVALQRRQAKEAREWLDKALKLAPKSAQVHVALARYHLVDGKPAKAEAELKSALALEPGNVRVQMALGDLYVNELKSPIQALEHYRAVIARDARNGAAHYGLGMALAGTGKAALAEEEFRTAAGISPKNPLPLLALGRLYSGQGQADKALAALADALARQPGFVAALTDRGDLFLDRGDAAPALKEYRLAARSAPKSGLPQLKIGMALHALARLDEAEAAYRGAIALDPRMALAYNNLAWMYFERGKDPAQALAWARKAVELAPLAAAFHDALGWILRGQGELAEAEKVLVAAVKMKPETAETWHHLGVVHLERKDELKAIAAFRRAVAIRKDYAPARDALAKLGR